MSGNGGGRLPASVSRALWGWYGRLAWDRVAADARHAAIGSLIALLESAASRHGDLVLDAGCGTGEVAVALAQAGYRVVAADSAPGMLRVLERKLRASAALPITVARADLASRWPWEAESFDHVTMVSVLQLLPEPARALAECARVLRPGGCCVVAQGHGAPRPAASGAAPWLRSLVGLKRLADRRAAMPRWSGRELSALLQASGFEPAGVSEGEMVAVVGRRLARTAVAPSSAAGPARG